MAKATIYLDTRRKLNDHTFPIRIRVSSGSDRRYYSSGFYADRVLFEKLLNITSRLSVKETTIRNELIRLKEKADKAIVSMSVFSFGAFEKSFLKSTDEKSYLVFHSLHRYENQLLIEGRVSSSDSYRLARKSMELYVKERKKYKHPKFGDIDESWLREYEEWMLERQRSLSTVGIYTRNLKRVFNIAISRGVIDRTSYPFSKDKYLIPSTRNYKRALSPDQIRMIYQYDCTSSNPSNYEYNAKWLHNMEWARDMWILSFLCNGVNFKDIASWKWKHHDSDYIRFYREKTLKTSRIQKLEIEIKLSPLAREIIRKYSSKSLNPEDHVFPYLSKDMRPSSKQKTIKQYIKVINKWIKRISKKLSFDVEPTFIWARHSYATISRNKGASLDFISKSLGHQSIKTTQNYLSSFGEEEILKNQRNLIKVLIG